MFCKPFPHGTELSMFTNNHHQRVAPLVSPSLSYTAYLDCSQNETNPLKVIHRHELYSHQQNFLPSAVRQPKLLPKVSKTRAQFGTRVFLLYSSKLFEPLFLSVMQLFHLVALFSRFTFVLLSAEDA